MDGLPKISSSFVFTYVRCWLILMIGRYHKYCPLPVQASIPLNGGAKIQLFSCPYNRFPTARVVISHGT